jgi:hypothetical protein
MVTSMKICAIGNYETKDGRLAIITRISGTKAHGRMPGNYDRTWWYVSNGEHAICPVDDLVRKSADRPVDNSMTES